MKPHEALEAELMKDQLEKSLPAMLGAYPVLAKMHKAYYDELIRAEFSESQALHIVTIQGVMAGTGGNHQ